MGAIAGAAGAGNGTRINQKDPSAVPSPPQRTEPPPDEVFLEGLRFYAYHGVNPEERVQGQRFLVDIRLVADLRAAGEADDLARTLNYSTAYKRVRSIVEGEPRNLIEAVAEEIAAALLADFPDAAAVTVTVRKPEVALKGAILDAAGVRIHRRRESPQP